MNEDPRLEYSSPTSKKAGTFFHRLQLSEAPFTGGRFVVEPGVTSALDQHKVRECWMVARGSGTLFYDDRSYPVDEGMVLFFESEHTHRIRNDGNRPLEIFSVWWQP